MIVRLTPSLILIISKGLRGYTIRCACVQPLIDNEKLEGSQKTTPERILLCQENVLREVKYPFGLSSVSWAQSMYRKSLT
jgi:hypothetical protein